MLGSQPSRESLSTRGIAFEALAYSSYDYATYYEDMGSEDAPFSYIKVIPLIGADARSKRGGFDHAGKWETSLLMGTYPELVDLSRCEKIRNGLPKVRKKPVYKRENIW